MVSKPYDKSMKTQIEKFLLSFYSEMSSISLGSTVLGIPSLPELEVDFKQETMIHISLEGLSVWNMLFLYCPEM